MDLDPVIMGLSQYAQQKNANVYLVGGAVRDILLKKSRVGKIDYDIAGTLPISDVEDYANSRGLEFTVKNKKLQVCQISIESCVYEYARLRVEHYDNATDHNPSSVRFTSVVAEDAKRRDFTINSIYYDTHNRSLVDPLGGLEDLAGNLIRTCQDASVTLACDPSRIIRLVELAARLDFKIYDDVEKVAKANFGNVFLLTKGRLQKEVARLKMFPKYQGESVLYKQRLLRLIKKLNLEEILTQ